jgi:hypothetical protein
MTLDLGLIGRGGATPREVGYFRGNLHKSAAFLAGERLIVKH